MTRLGRYVVHPIADKFPLILGEEFDSLVNDIKTNGLREPIKVDHEDLVLVDGRNRFLACQAASVEPKFEQLPEYDELDLIFYIISLNIHRRELTAGQKGMLGAEIEPDIAKATKDRETKRKESNLMNKLDISDMTGLNRGPDSSMNVRSASVVCLCNSYTYRHDENTT